MSLGLLLALVPMLQAAWGCDAFDEALLEDARNGDIDGAVVMDGGGEPGADAAMDGALDVCMAMDEACNGEDDDCDGRVDEDTRRVCEEIVLNADTGCFVTRDGPRCVRIACYEGFADLDGNPANGCEPIPCEGDACDDAGADDDAGATP
ncbi:MAG: hypothetical protein PVI30_00440 [Myxococcales bacterium]